MNYRSPGSIKTAAAPGIHLRTPAGSQAPAGASGGALPPAQKSSRDPRGSAGLQPNAKEVSCTLNPKRVFPLIHPPGLNHSCL